MSHPLDKAFSFDLTMSGDHPVLRHHSVHGRPLVPGVTWLNVIVQALQGLGVAVPEVELRDIVFPQALSLDAGERRVVTVAYEPEGRTLAIGSDGGREQHCRCRLARLPDAPGAPPAGAESSSFRVPSDAPERSLDDVYANARALAIRHGRWMRGEGSARVGAESVVADIALGEEALVAHERYPLHPALLDCATLVPFAAGGFGVDPTIPFIPIAIGRVRALATGFARARVSVRLSPGASHNDDVLHHDIVLADADGEPLLEIARLSAKRVRSADAIGAAGDGAEVPRAAAAQALAPAAPGARVEEGAAEAAASATDEAPERALARFIADAAGIGPIEDPTLGFYELGLDSATLLGLAQSLEKAVGRELYPTLLYEHGSVRQLARWLQAEGLGLDAAAPVADEAAADAAPAADIADALVRSAEAHAVAEEASALHWFVPHWLAAAADEVVDDAVQGWYAYGEEPRAGLAPWHGRRDARGLYWSVEGHEDLHALLAEAVSLARAVLAHEGPLQLLVRTDGEAQAAALVPFLRSLAREAPRISGRVVSGELDRPAEESAPVAAGIEWISRRRDDAPGPRRSRQALRAVDRPPERCEAPEEAIVVTGGTGAIGGHLLGELFAGGARRFALLARREPSAPFARELDRLRERGAEILCLGVDVAEPDELRDAWRRVKARFDRVGGVLHCAGLVSDALLRGKRADEAAAVLAVKHDALRLLDELSAAEPLEFFAVCGSVTGVLGNLGQADYAFANGAVAGFLRQRSREVAVGARRGRSVCIDWPYWAEGGMRIDAARAEALREETGLDALATPAALSAWRSALAGEHGESLPLTFAPCARERVARFVERCGTTLLAGPDERTDDLAGDEPAAENERRASDCPPPTVPSAGEAPIAIIGLAGEYPGAPNLEALWELLREGRDAVAPVPPSRWDHEALYGERGEEAGAIYCRDGGFIDDHDRFDAAFFNITPREARLMDPQERRFLQSAWSCVEQAGIDPAGLDGASVGVYVGVMWGQYQMLGADADGRAVASIYAAIANRVSYTLNLTGPSLALDSMCSSSLSAMHLALEALRRGECAMAIAGGVNLMLHPHKYRFLCQNHMLSERGRCRSFGDDADGYVPGEGVGAVLLKPLGRALADGDPIRAVIRGSALNHGGRGAGMTVPSPAAQASVIRRAHAQAASGGAVSYIEAHGTGTSLGDPIEIEGLRQAFAEDGPESCAVGSIKSNIGHLEGAAGIAALSKVVLQLEHGTLVGSLHAETLNPRLRLDGTPFHVRRGTAPWTAAPRVAGISAFGAGGSNAHLVVGEAPPSPPAPARDGGEALVVPVSARDEAALRRYLERWRDFLGEPRGRALPLARIAATAQGARRAFERRVAIVATDHDQALAAFERALEAAAPASRVFCAVTDPDDARDDLRAARALADAFVGGAAPDWPAGDGARVGIPTYPFLGDRHAIEPSAAGASQERSDPLLHAPQPSLESLRYASRWSEAEPLLDQHRIEGETLMPAAMMLETVRRALEPLAPGGACRLESVRLGAPCAVAADTELATELFRHGASTVAELRRAGSETLCMQAFAGGAPTAPERLSPPLSPALRERTEPLYAALGERGLDYGEWYRSLRESALVDGARWARLTLPSTSAWRRSILAIDAAMQTSALCVEKLADDTSVWLPCELVEVDWYGDPAAACWARALPLGDTADLREFELTLLDERGEPLWRAARFGLRPRRAPRAVPVGDARETAPVSGGDALLEPTRAHLATLLSQACGLEPAELLRRDGFAEIGIDSVAVIDVTFALERRLGTLPKDLFFTHAGLRELAAWLLAAHGPAMAEIVGGDAGRRAPRTDGETDGETAAGRADGDAPDAAQGRASRAPRVAREPLRSLRAARAVREPLAVIGMAGRFADAEDVERLWENLARGHDAVSEIPAERWPWQLFHREDRRLGSYCRQGSFIADVECFDADFFGMTPADARQADPQERLLLETAWHAMENAGYSRKSLVGDAVGVFAASMWHQYQHFGVDAALRGERPATHSLLSSIANRISYALGVSGPSVALDTMCSGSMTALHLAAQAIENGDCEAALVGGVNLSLHPLKYINLSNGGFLSERGRCASFGDGADGYVPAEAVACIMVKPLDKAIACGDPIHGVIRATAINHVGTTSGRTVPSAAAQASVIGRALERAGVAPRQISYVEAHGTGTALGDPIELDGLSRALDADGGHPGCLIGSVKSNLGHAEAASGLVGIIKVLLQFRHGRIAPTLHADTENPALDLSSTPFRLARELSDWRSDDGPFAAVSAFGAGGSNAHVVLQAYRPEASVETSVAAGEESRLVPLSARNERRLRAQAGRLRGWLERHRSVPLEALAATLALGREEHPSRVALIASSVDELIEQLAPLADDASGRDGPRVVNEVGGDGLGGLFDDLDGQRYLDGLLRERRLPKLAQLWLNGVSIDWRALFDEGQRRLALPGYAFERVAHRVEHGLEGYALDFENVSDLFSQRYRVGMPGHHPALADHVIDGERRVSLALMSKLALEALRRADGESVWQLSLEVRQPWVVGGRLGCEIALEPDGEGVTLRIEGEKGTIAVGAATALDPAAIAAERVDVETLSRDLVDAAGFYRRFADEGYRYGESYRAVESIATGASRVLARLRDEESVPGSPSAPHAGALSAGALDAGLQLTRELLDDGRGTLWLPIGLSLRIDPGQVPEATRAARWVLIERRARDERSASFGARWLDAQGLLVAAAETTLGCRRVEPELARCLLLRRRWCEAPPLGASGLSDAEPIIVGEPDGEGPGSLEELLARLESKPLPRALAVILRHDPSVATEESFRRLWSGLRELRRRGLAELALVVRAEQADPTLLGLTSWFRAVEEEIPGFRARVVLGAADASAEELLAECTQRQTLIRHDGGDRSCRGLSLLGEDARDIPLGEDARDADEASAAMLELGGRAVLLTGGAGGLGVELARHLAAEHGANPVLVGRRAPDEEIRSLLDALRRLGVEPSYYSADIACAEDCRLLERKITLRYGALHGIVHAAGVSRDAWLVDQRPEAVAGVLAPKVAGTANVLALARAMRPRWLVAFGSISGFLGNPGQSDYSFANAWMDAACEAAELPHTRVLSIAWPLWKDIGMQPDARLLEQLEKRFGMRPLPVATGIALFEKLLRERSGAVLAVFGDTPRLRRWLAGREAGLPESDATATPQAATSAAEPVSTVEPPRQTVASADAARLAASDTREDRLAQARRRVARAVEEVTQIPADTLDWNRPLDEFGISSVMATSIVGALSEHAEGLPAGLLYECRNWREVADHLLASAAPAATAESGGDGAEGDEGKTPATPAPAPRASGGEGRRRGYRLARRGGDIAVVGAACRFPGAPDMERFWELLASGGDAVTEIPPERWDWRAFADGASATSMRGGFIDGIDRFDYPFFGISLGEAKAMDPQERLVLESAWHALEDAGIAPDSLAGRPVGVYVGAMWNQYQLLGSERWRARGIDPGSNGSVASIANRLSFLLDLAGPSLALDTMCSSALMSLKLASDALRAGEIDVALVGGVNVSLHPYKYRQLLSSTFLSPEGRCAAFAADGDGYVPAEGVGMVVLKRAASARQDGDRARALIKGVGVVHGGRSNGYYVPRPQAQAQAITAALRDGDVAPETVSYVEAHGTGTRLGDPIEISGLRMAYAQDEPVSRSLGSVKANIGHGESASGMASLCKVLLQMEHRSLAPSIHSEPQNPDLGLEPGGFAVQRELAEWRVPEAARHPLRAGISCFGAGGLNVHVVLEAGGDARPPSVPPVAEAGEATLPPQARLVLFSAHTEEALRALVAGNLERLAGDPASLRQLAAATQLGRQALGCRLAVVADGRQALLDALAGWLDGETVDALRSGRATSVALETDAPASLATTADALALAERWVGGERIDWSRYWPAGTPRVALAAYPFRRLRVWIDSEAPGQATTEPSPAGDAAPAPVAAPALPSSQATAAVDAVVAGDRAPEERLRRVRAAVAEVLGVEQAAIEPDLPFDRMGMDSIAASRCAELLHERFGHEIDPTWLFNHPSVERLAAALPAPGTAATGVADEGRAAAAAPVAAGSPEEPIAIVGVSGAFAGAPDLERFWDNLVNGRDSVGAAGEGRWDIDAYHSADGDARGKSRSRRMGQLEGAELFDPAAFNLMPEEALAMDPQQRLFLKHAMLALDDAAIAPETIDGSRCGVYAGAMSGSYRALLGEEAGTSAAAMLGNHSALLPARVAYLLNLQGPTLAVDTACSSSLVAVHLACQALRHGECELAVAGGVHVAPTPEEMIASSQAGMLSPGGQCRAFDDAADGIAIGEGVGVVVLKRLSRAVADGDPIRALLRASGVNQDGRTNGITAPNAISQAALISRVFDAAGLAADDIQYLECHGTGTRLGDPVEVDGIRRALAAGRSRPLPIGSVKPNIGHCYAAAGIAGLLKLVMSLEHGRLPPSIGFERPNALIDFERAGVRVHARLDDWPEATVRRAALSAFGYSGTNAHLIVEAADAPPTVRPAAPATALVLPLSARKPALVVAQARRLAAALRRDGCALAEVAWTLQGGRKAERFRAAIVASDLDAAIARLEALDEDAVRRATPADAVAAAATASTEAERVAERWLAGETLDWRALWEGAPPRRVPLPGKAYDERRCWPERSAPSAAVAGAGARAERAAPDAAPGLRRVGREAFERAA